MLILEGWWINLGCFAIAQVGTPCAIVPLVGSCYEPMNKTDKELSKLTSVFSECGKGSVS